MDNTWTEKILKYNDSLVLIFMVHLGSNCILCLALHFVQGQSNAIELISLSSKYRIYAGGLTESPAANWATAEQDEA